MLLLNFCFECGVMGALGLAPSPPGSRPPRGVRNDGPVSATAVAMTRKFYTVVSLTPS
jgi:hypothetical protein